MASTVAVIAYGKDNVDKTTLSFSLALAALDAGEQVSIVLLSEGVRFGVQGHADGANNGAPFKSINDLMTDAETRGAKLYVSGACMQKRNLKDQYMLPRFRRIELDEISKILAGATRTIQL
jgi:predicted peroxiredoxin